jgi:hypothetical protein
MKLIGNIEVSGVTRIVIKKKDSTRIYLRNDNRDWIDQTSGKVILDKYMGSRVRKMVILKKDFSRRPIYRLCPHLETLNFEKLYYE